MGLIALGVLEYTPNSLRFSGFLFNRFSINMIRLTCTSVLVNIALEAVSGTLIIPRMFVIL